MIQDLVVDGVNWSANGIPARTKEGTCVILGDADSGPKFIRQMHPRRALYAVNRAGMFRSDVDLLVTQCPTSSDIWQRHTWGPDLVKVVSMEEPADEIVKFDGPHGSSGFYAALVALHHGWDKIVLCGVDMSGEYRRFLRVWHWYHDLLEPHIRSVAGCTKELFGEPEPGWLTQ